MRLLRIVPDDTKFDFMRFRRISFPMSALLSIMAILLYFYHGLNFGIDFVGGTLMEVQSKAGPADLAKMRSTLSGLGVGEVQLQQFGAPTDVLIRLAQQPGGEFDDIVTWGSLNTSACGSGQSLTAEADAEDGDSGIVSHPQQLQLGSDPVADRRIVV